MLMIADGAGGQRGGACASAIAVHELTAAPEAADRQRTSLRETILDGIEAANRDRRPASARRRRSSWPSCAATAAPLPRRRLASRLRPEGQAQGPDDLPLPTGYAVEAGLLNERDAPAARRAPPGLQRHRQPGDAHRAAPPSSFPQGHRAARHRRPLRQPADPEIVGAAAHRAAGRGHRRPGARGAPAHGGRRRAPLPASRTT